MECPSLTRDRAGSGFLVSPSSGSLFPQKAGKGGIPTPGWMGTGEAAPQFLEASKTHWDGNELKNEKQLGFGIGGGENAFTLVPFCEQFQSPLKCRRGTMREGKGAKRLPQLKAPVLAAFQS